MDVYSLQVGSLPEDVRVLAFQGAEEISTLYAFELTLIAPETSAAPIDAAVGEDATFSVHRDDGTVRAQYHGVVVSAEFVHALSQHVLFRVVVRPRAWRMTLNERSRVWVDKKVSDVIEDVLKTNGLAAGTDYRLSLSGSYPVQEHFSQYHESDWDYVSRRMEREGIYYYFEQGDGREVLVLTDDVASLTSGPESPVRFFAVSSRDASTVEAMHSFRSRRQMVAQQTLAADYNYLTPTTAISATSPVADGGVGRVSVFGGNHLTGAEAKRLAKVRAEEKAAPQTVFQGRGRVFELRAGFRFELSDHPVPALNREYLATRVLHHGVGDQSVTEFLPWLVRPDWDPRPLARGVYSVEVFAQGSDVPYRAPCRTKVPKVIGLESARIDGAADDDYAQLDASGRYHVKILFDESPLKDSKASTWVRMMQPHGGEPEGFHFPLRKGTEVLLGFIGGDPDRPIIVGVGPDADHPSPVTEANHTQNVIMTGGRNRIEIEDLDGSQSVGIYSPTQNSTLHMGAHAGPYHQGHNFTLTTDGNGLIHTGGDRNVTVGANQTEDVTGDLTETYHATQTTHVTGAFTETIDGGATQTISSGETRTVTGGVTETITGGEKRTVNGGQTEHVSGSVTRTIASAFGDTILGSVTRTITGGQTDTIAGELVQNVMGGITIVTPANVDLTGVGGISIMAPGGFTMLAPGGTHVFDDFFENIGGQFDKKYGVAGTTTPFKFEAILFLSIAGTAVKIENNLAKIVLVDTYADAVGMKQDAFVAKLKKATVILALCGCLLLN